MADDRDPFFQCRKCRQTFSSATTMKTTTTTNTGSSTAHELLHPRAPVVGRCGDTICAGCASEAHAHALEGKSSQLKHFSCPLPDCRHEKSFQADRLAVNLQFRFALEYWEALIQYADEYRRFHKPKPSIDILGVLQKATREELYEGYGKFGISPEKAEKLFPYLFTSK